MCMVLVVGYIVFFREPRDDLLVKKVEALSRSSTGEEKPTQIDLPHEIIWRSEAIRRGERVSPDRRHLKPGSALRARQYKFSMSRVRSWVGWSTFEYLCWKSKVAKLPSIHPSSTSNGTTTGIALENA